MGERYLERDDLFELSHVVVLLEIIGTVIRLHRKCMISFKKVPVEFAQGGVLL